MRGRTTGIMAALVLFFGSTLRAQTPTPTPTPGPTPTPTRPPHLYLSDETVVNTETTNNQKRPSVAVGTDGNYMIVWHSDAAQQFYFDIKGQLFTHDGVPIGGEFQVDQAGANRIQYTPDIAAGGNGNYIVVWADFNQTVTDSEVWMRLYDGAANPLGNAVQVNTYTTGKQRLPRVAADTAGKFVAVWESEGQDGSGLGVFGQQFDAVGAPVGGEIAVNTTTTGDQDRATVDMDDQGFTVAFDDGSSGIAAREFGAFAPLGGQFSVFGPNHRFADVARLDGANNTFYVAENTTSVSIDGIRTESGVPRSPFTIAPGGLNPRVSHQQLATGFALPARPSTAAQDALVAVWEDYYEEYKTYCQQYGIDGSGRLLEINQKINFLDGVDVPDIDVGGYGQFVAVGQSAAIPSPDGSGAAVEQVHGGSPTPKALVLFDDNANGVLDPNESAQFSAVLENLGPLAEYAGLATNVYAPQTLTITDATADYGMIAAGGTGDCQATGDCYGTMVSGARPGLHWDEAVVETLNTGVHKTWLLHIGNSFADVPTTNLFYKFIENLLHNGVTSGGACGGYCPTDGVKRQQMAVFLLKSRYGSNFTPPPATGMVFDDVPITNPFAPWIETLALLGVTGGCVVPPPPALPSFCPDNIVNRQQMAVFLLKTLEGAAYTPPAAVGIFQDVPLSNPFVAWVEELYNRLVTGGCVANPLQYCPTNPTNRQQMAAFLVKTFGLLLYGP